MAQKSKSRTAQKSSYRGFEGINPQKTHSGDESVAWINNFHITEDGSLKKRCGFKDIYTSTNKKYKATSSFCTEESGKTVHYFTEGYYVRKYIPSTGEVKYVCELYENTVNTFFFKFLDGLFICDGKDIYDIKENFIDFISPYVPLYGKDWPSGVPGEKCEPLNLLSNKAAISYKLTAPATSYLALGDLEVQSIDKIYRNGTLLANDTYDIDKKFNLIVIYDFEPDDVFLAIVNLKNSGKHYEQQKTLLSSQAASTFYELNQSNLFFWGNPSCNKIFYSRALNEEITKITSPYISYSSLYMPMDSYFTVGSEADRVNALIRHYDRVLVMTDSSTWITNFQDFDGKNLTLKSINSEIGCSVFNGCTRIGNTLISIGKDAVYFWTSDTDELNECNAYSISDTIKNLIPQNFFSSCVFYFHKNRKELWFCNEESEYVWVYNLNRKAWYTLSGFSPYKFMETNGEIMFFEDKSTYTFDPSLTYDKIGETEKEIIATFKSGELEFNSRGKKKLCTATVRGSASGGSLKASFLLDGKKSFTVDITPPKSHSVIPTRTRSGSFRSLCFELTASGGGKQTIHGIELDAD